MTRTERLRTKDRRSLGLSVLCLWLFVSLFLDLCLPSFVRLMLTALPFHYRLPSPQWLHFFKNILFYIEVQLTNNVVVVSGAQQSDSAIHIHVSILPQTPCPSRLSHNTEQSSLCCTVGPCWLSILSIAVCTCPSQVLF